MGIQTKWQVEYERSYDSIPLFSEPYKIKACGKFDGYKNIKENISLFLKSHERKYLLTVNNSLQSILVETVSLEFYQKNIQNNCKILLLPDTLFIPQNNSGIMTSNLLIYSAGYYGCSIEIGQKELFDKKLSKEDFMLIFFKRYI